MYYVYTQPLSSPSLCSLYLAPSCPPLSLSSAVHKPFSDRFDILDDCWGWVLRVEMEGKWFPLLKFPLLLGNFSVQGVGCGRESGGLYVSKCWTGGRQHLCSDSLFDFVCVCVSVCFVCPLHVWCVGSTYDPSVHGLSLAHSAGGQSRSYM